MFSCFVSCFGRANLEDVDSEILHTRKSTIDTHSPSFPNDVLPGDLTRERAKSGTLTTSGLGLEPCHQTSALRSINQDSNSLSFSITRHPRQSGAPSLIGSIRNSIVRFPANAEGVTSAASPSLAVHSPGSPDIRARKSSKLSRRKKNKLSIKSQSPSREEDHVDDEDCQIPRLRTYSDDPFAPPTPGLTPIAFQHQQLNTAPDSAKSRLFSNSYAFRDSSSTLTNVRRRSSTIAAFSQRYSHPEKQTQDRYQSTSSPLATKPKRSISVSRADSYRMTKDLNSIQNASKNTTPTVCLASIASRITSFHLSEDISKEWDTAKLFLSNLASDEGETSIETVLEEPRQPHLMREQIKDHHADHKITGNMNPSPDLRAQAEGNRGMLQNAAIERLPINVSKTTGRHETTKDSMIRKISQLSMASHLKDQHSEKYPLKSSGLGSSLSKSICSVYYSAVGHHD